MPNNFLARHISACSSSSRCRRSSRSWHGLDMSGHHHVAEMTKHHLRSHDVLQSHTCCHSLAMATAWPALAFYRLLPNSSLGYSSVFLFQGSHLLLEGFHVILRSCQKLCRCFQTYLPVNITIWPCAKKASLLAF